jgi:hypothetical protein
MTVLIHGFGTGITYSIFQQAQPKNAGFLIFEDLINRNLAQVFDWRIRKTLKWWQILLIFPILDIYWQEKTKSQSLETQEKLAKFLEFHQPKTIICHSMGANLFFKHSFLLPKSVQKIILIQADISHKSAIPTTWQNISIINYFCPWDNALLASNFINLKIMAGQIGLKNAQNIFFPLILNNPNLHTSSLKSQKFLKKIGYE